MAKAAKNVEEQTAIPAPATPSNQTRNCANCKFSAIGGLLGSPLLVCEIKLPPFVVAQSDHRSYRTHPTATCDLHKF